MLGRPWAQAPLDALQFVWFCCIVIKIGAAWWGFGAGVAEMQLTKKRNCAPHQARKFLFICRQAFPPLPAPGITLFCRLLQTHSSRRAAPAQCNPTRAEPTRVMLGALGGGLRTARFAQLRLVDWVFHVRGLAGPVEGGQQRRRGEGVREKAGERRRGTCGGPRGSRNPRRLGWGGGRLRLLHVNCTEFGSNRKEGMHCSFWM